MTPILTLRHERIDDIPLILGLARHLHLEEVLERHLGTHSLQQGWSNGQLAVGWLAYILSQADHRLSAVRDWANSLPHTLEQFGGLPVREVEFSDDRLGGLLRRLSHDTRVENWRYPGAIRSAMMTAPAAASSFAALLLQARQAAGLSRGALAQRVGLDVSHVYRIEKGGRRPSREAVLALAEVLGVQGEAMDTWLTAADYAPAPLLSRVRGAIRTRGRGRTPGATPEPASTWDAALWAQWLETMGLQEATIGALLRGLEQVSMAERQALTEAVGSTFRHLIERLQAPVRTAVIPAAGGQHRLLAQHVMQLLLLRAIREAVESGLGQIILILPPGMGEMLYTPLKAALDLAVVPPLILHYCEQARPDGLGDAILQAEALVGDEPFAVLLPDDIVRERIGRPLAAWELRHMLEALRQAPGAHVLAVTTLPRSHMPHSGVVQVAPQTGEMALQPIVQLVEKPHLQAPICRAPRVFGIVGRYLLQASVFHALKALKGQRPLHLAAALERLRQAGERLYACELAGRRREDLGRVLGEARAVLGESAESAPPA